MSWFIFIALIVFVIILLVFAFLVVAVAIQGAPFVPTGRKKMAIIKRFASIKPEGKVADLGSGDGRLVIAISRSGTKIDGYEINPGLVFISRLWIRLLGLRGKASIYSKSFWNVDLSSYDVVIIYGIDYIMERLEKKLFKELKPGARVISNNFKFPNWKYREKDDKVFLYVR